MRNNLSFASIVNVSIKSIPFDSSKNTVKLSEDIQAVFDNENRFVIWKCV